jgi:hypothetical protein
MTRMRILVIPDIHLKTWIFDRAEDILKTGNRIFSLYSICR